MTEPEPSESDELLKADVLGRVRARPEHRERMLDAFEASAMSGQAFAIHHGLIYWGQSFRIDYFD
jgi:hypothetical protein